MLVTRLESVLVSKLKEPAAEPLIADRPRPAEL